MADIVSPFTVSYGGNDADRHVIDALTVGMSLTGGARLYTAVAHYCAFGYIPRGNYRKHFRCYAKPPRDGSYEYGLFIATILQEYELHGELYRAGIGFIFSRVVEAIKKILTRKGETATVVEALAEVMKTQAEKNADVNMVLANGLIQANNRISDLSEKLLETLPSLAESNRGNARLFVAPIGNTCRTINQVFGAQINVSIDEADADAIRETNLEVDDMQNFLCKEITEVNVNTGHCIVAIEGINVPIIGKISDPALRTPDNVYTRSLNAKSPFLISAKPVKRNGTLYKLYISDAKQSAL